MLPESTTVQLERFCDLGYSAGQPQVRPHFYGEMNIVTLHLRVYTRRSSCALRLEQGETNETHCFSPKQ